MTYRSPLWVVAAARTRALLPHRHGRAYPAPHRPRRPRNASGSWDSLCRAPASASRTRGRRIPCGRRQKRLRRCVARVAR